MARSLSVRVGWRAVLVVAVLALFPALSEAQTGRVTGTVVGEAGPVQGAQVSVVGTRLGSLTDARGRFTVSGVPAGTQQLRVTHIGLREVVQPVTVPADGTAELEVRLEGQPVELGGVVVSASRRAERVTDAPVTITRIEPEAVENSVGNSWAAALKEVKGLDFIQLGIASAAINARGFNSSFNNRMLMLVDGRVSVLPESGLPVGQFTPIPKIDIAGIEVIVGPGAALYGADASNGVVFLQTKDPRAFPGTTVEVVGGSRSYRDIQARHAGSVGNFAYKITGEWMEADDFENFLDYPVGKVRVPETPDVLDWHTEAQRLSGSLAYYLEEDDRLEFSAGWSSSDGVGQTNVGRNQFRDWTYNFLQAEYTTPSWYLNLYRNQSQSGESFAVNRFVVNEFVQKTLLGKNPSFEELRLASDWPSNGRTYAAEVQNNLEFPSLLGAELTWGAQYRRDLVSSDREWLTDRFTDEDVEIGQYGLYAQVEVPVIDQLELIAAGRYDDHENYDAQFSPKLGVLFKPARDQALRLTYNQAFKSPTILATNFFIPDFVPGIGVFGNVEGFTVRDTAGATLFAVAPLVPESNETWELGYRGIIGGRLLVDVTGYRSEYENFFGSLRPINVPAAGTFAFDAQGQRVVGPTGIPQLVLTYQNLGQATIRGVDSGIRYALTPQFDLKGTLSWIELSDVEEDPKDPQATALNSPEMKWTLGADGEFGRFRGDFLVRHVSEYDFASGINVGTIPGFTTTDMSLGYRVPQINSMLTLGVSNLFTCRGEVEVDGVLESESGCGFGERHIEMINMPEIGTMVYVGLRYHTQ